MREKGCYTFWANYIVKNEKMRLQSETSKFQTKILQNSIQFFYILKAMNKFKTIY